MASPGACAAADRRPTRASWVGLGLVVAVLAILGVQAARVAVAAFLGARDLESLAALAERFPGNTAYATLLARADIVSGRLAEATQGLNRALARNPGSAGLWLELGRAAVGRGDGREAARAAIAARRRAPTSAETCYQAAVMLLEAKAVVEALAALRCAVDLDPQRAREVYDLAWAVVADGPLIRQAIVPDSTAGWSGYASYVRVRRADEATAAWAELARHGASAGERLDHIDFLLKRGRGPEAAHVWAETYGARTGNLVHNGSFEGDPVGRGLGWMLGTSDGARTSIVALPGAPDGQRVLQVTFTGANVDYQHASQIVPVAEGQRYRVRAMVRTENLRSMSLPRVTVRGYARCPLAEIGGREWKGTVAWTQETFDFDVPSGCSVILLQVRRRPAGRFGRDIAGNLWIDQIRIELSSDETV